MSQLCAHKNCFQGAIKSMTHGFSYGAKVRFTHSLVMAILFSNETLLGKLLKILKNTKEHSFKLALYALIYKSVSCFLTQATNRQRSLYHGIAGLIAGFVWFEDTPVNTQIAFYLLSRSLMAKCKFFYRNNYLPISKTLANNGVWLLNLIAWGMSLYLFELDSSVLQNSLTSSMVFLYKDSDTWRGWRYCIPYLDPVLKLFRH